MKLDHPDLGTPIEGDQFTGMAGSSGAKSRRHLMLSQLCRGPFPELALCFPAPGPYLGQSPSFFRTLSGIIGLIFMS